MTRRYIDLSNFRRVGSCSCCCWEVRLRRNKHGKATHLPPCGLQAPRHERKQRLHVLDVGGGEQHAGQAGLHRHGDRQAQHGRLATPPARSQGHQSTCGRATLVNWRSNIKGNYNSDS